MAVSHSGQSPAKYYGLENQGATCYLNSVLQVLFMTDEFKGKIRSHAKKNPHTDYIDRQLSELFDDLEKNISFTYKITEKLRIDKVYEQRDAAEHYEKILRLASAEASQIFHGKLINRVTCLKCKTPTESEAGFWQLPLPLVDSNNDDSVEKGIEDFFRQTKISGDEQMYCEKCDEKCDAVLDCEVTQYPQVLVLLLKRFDFDYSYMTYFKNKQPVNVPHKLQMPENQMYELYAFVEHSGELRQGHYESTIRSQDDDTWYIFNDSTVTRARALPELKRSQKAYLLFYQKQQEFHLPNPELVPNEPDSQRSIKDNKEKTEAAQVVPAENNLKRDRSLHESEPQDYANVKKPKQEKLRQNADEPLQALDETGQQCNNTKQFPDHCSGSEDQCKGADGTSQTEAGDIRSSNRENDDDHKNDDDNNNNNNVGGDQLLSSDTELNLSLRSEQTDVTGKPSKNYEQKIQKEPVERLEKSTTESDIDQSDEDQWKRQYSHELTVNFNTKEEQNNTNETTDKKYCEGNQGCEDTQSSTAIKAEEQETHGDQAQTDLPSVAGKCEEQNTENDLSHQRCDPDVNILKKSEDSCNDLSVAFHITEDTEDGVRDSEIERTEEENTAGVRPLSEKTARETELSSDQYSAHEDKVCITPEDQPGPGTGALAENRGNDHKAMDSDNVEENIQRSLLDIRDVNNEPKTDDKEQVESPKRFAELDLSVTRDAQLKTESVKETNEFNDAGEKMINEGCGSNYQEPKKEFVREDAHKEKKLLTKYDLYMDSCKMVKQPQSKGSQISDTSNQFCTPNILQKRSEESDTESELSERAGQTERHKKQFYGIKSLGVTTEQDTEIYRYMPKKKQDYPLLNAKCELHENREGKDSLQGSQDNTNVGNLKDMKCVDSLMQSLEGEGDNRGETGRMNDHTDEGEDYRK